VAKRRPKTDAGTATETLARVRTAADERAARAGMRFDPERAAFVCDWIENYCRLYEGDKAGEPLLLLGFQRDFLSRLFGWVRWSDEWGQWVRRFTHGAFWGAKKNGKSPLRRGVQPVPPGRRRRARAEGLHDGEGLRTGPDRPDARGHDGPPVARST
jgi:hypothetical protein